MANIVFVDEDDNVIGSGTKREAWTTGVRHRVARIFFNSKGELLIQKRADNRESLPGRWDQSAAGHVDEGETYLEAANREMKEEWASKVLSSRNWGQTKQKRRTNRTR